MAPQQETPQQKPVAVWGTSFLKPMFFVEEHMQDQGLGDLMFKKLQDNLPQFQHTQTRASYPRMIAEMRNGVDMCSLLFYNTDRATFMAYSNAVAITPTYQIYTSLQGKAALDQALERDVREASLDEILAHSRELTLLITPNQTYGPVRDKIFAKHAKQLKIQHHLGNQAEKIKMLADNEAQMLLAMPWVFNYEQRVQKLQGQTAKIHLTDVPTYQTSYIACTDSELGRSVVEAINAIKPAAHTLLKTAGSKWLKVEELHSYHQSYLDHFAP
ncbi:MAG: hypothetical protein Aseana_01820 [Candidatus Pelagadaptatus aseana]